MTVKQLPQTLVFPELPVKGGAQHLMCDASAPVDVVATAYAWGVLWGKPPQEEDAFWTQAIALFRAGRLLAANEAWRREQQETLSRDLLIFPVFREQWRRATLTLAEPGRAAYGGC